MRRRIQKTHTTFGSYLREVAQLLQHNADYETCTPKLTFTITYTMPMSKHQEGGGKADSNSSLIPLNDRQIHYSIANTANRGTDKYNDKYNDDTRPQWRVPCPKHLLLRRLALPSCAFRTKVHS